MQRGTSTVTDIRLYSRENAQSLWQITLDRSPFQGGASRGKLTATAASGAVLVVEVEAVTHEAGEVWHLTRKPLPIGTEVTVEAFGEPPSGC